MTGGQCRGVGGQRPSTVDGGEVLNFTLEAVQVCEDRQVCIECTATASLHTVSTAAIRPNGGDTGQPPPAIRNYPCFDSQLK